MGNCKACFEEKHKAKRREATKAWRDRQRQAVAA